MIKKSFYSSLLVVAGIAAVLGSCDKNKPYDVLSPDAKAHFTNTAGSTSQYVPYYVTNDPASIFNVTVGLTNVESSDRTVTYKVSSTSAVAGTAYTIAGLASGTGTVTIPSGKSTANIPLHGIFAAYPANKRDTIIFTLSEPSVPTAKFLDTVRVVLQRYCNVVLTSVAGPYTRTYEGTYGPYTSSVINLTATTATTATGTLTNVYDSGITATGVVFNWTDPANFTVTIPEQNTGMVASGYQVWIRTSGGTGNTFSSCDNTITLKIDLLAKTAAGALAGYFEQNYVITMAK